MFGECMTVWNLFVATAIKDSIRLLASELILVKLLVVLVTINS